jgi:hypothetical protein
MTNYRFGQSAIMPRDKPFYWEVDGKTYLLRHSLNDAGEITMSVDLADRTSHQMHDAPPRRRPAHITHDIDDESAYDENGIIKDGHSIRVKLQEMRDANRNSAPLVINSGMRLDKEFYLDGTPKNRDDERRQRKTAYRDPYGREGGTFEEEDAAYAAHRPHFVDADRSASENARAQLIRDTASAWRSPEQKAQNETSVSDACPAGTDPREWAFDQYVRDTQNAWRPRDTLNPQQSVGQQTRAIPETLPAGAYAAVGTGPAEGDRITFNGRPAKLVRRGNFLYPEFIPTGPTRSSETVNPDVSPSRPSDHAVVGDRSAIDAAWRELQERTNSAWQNGG